MRYVVNFAHRRYLAIQKRLLADPTFDMPTGMYRQISVVVDASGEADAVDKALKELGWPDLEMDLVPLGVTSQRALVDQLRETLPAWYREAAESEASGDKP